MVGTEEYRKTGSSVAILIILLNCLVLFPLLLSGYISDDAINSYSYGIAKERNLNIYEFAKSINAIWINEGRFFPLAFYMYFLFSIIRSLIFYKITILILVLFNIILFGYFVKLLTKSNFLAVLSTILPSYLFQFRLPHDPILGFHWLLELVLLLTISSLIFLYYSLNASKFKYLFLSLSLFTFLISTLMYEITYTFILLHMIIIVYYSPKWRSGVKQYIKKIIPFVVVILIVGGISFALRLNKNSGLVNGTYDVNFSVGKYFYTLIKQTYAAFPLSHLTFNSSMLSNLKDVDLKLLIIPILFIICINVILFSIFLKNHSLKSVLDQKSKHLLLIGVAFLILPSLLISLSPKYQNEIVWGYGYLPVYISYFGLIILLLYLISMIFIRTTANNRGVMVSVFFILSAGLGILNFINNMAVATEANRSYLYPREVIQNALQSGLLDSPTNDSILLVGNSYLWDVSAFYNIYSSAHVSKVKVISKYDDVDVSDADSKFYLDYKATRKQGYAIISNVKEIYNINGTVKGITGNGFRLFIPNKNLRDDVNINGYWAEKENPDKYESFRLTIKDFIVKEYTEEGVIYSYFNDNKIMDVKSLDVNGFGNLGRSLLVKENAKGFLLKNDHEDVVLHTGFENKLFNQGIVLEPVKLTQSFSIEMVVTPGKKQVSYAHIFGNHPGFNNFEGFVLQQNNNNNNEFMLSYGDGNGFNDLLSLSLSPEKNHYLVYSFNKRNVSIYLNGLLASTVIMPSDFVNSDMPFYIGNWINGDRPFDGALRDLRITNKNMEQEEITQNWLYIHGMLNEIQQIKGH
ncbi:LamG-like jellyroll fold domain-containing protein [Paenibacillus fonticola]|uniref:LamG-like jellyroll fold domain-containing protein n=1 Tax=Paenibacillus fonticola TaxID=379896 RepID=UPI00035DDA3B|nr:LamG-like jellyroll fold domain-containing protein [Paenibacillus fonticola]